MRARLTVVRRGVVALFSVGLVSSGVFPGSSARAVTPGSNDRIAYVHDNDELRTVRSDGLGNSEAVLSGCGALADPSWAPDNTRLVVHTAGCAPLVVVEVDGMSAGLDHASGAEDPSWSPDGRWIAVERDGDIWTLPAPPLGGGGDTAGSPVRVTFDGPSVPDEDPTWSPDGRHIAFTRPGPNGFRQIAIADVPDASGPIPFKGTTLTDSMSDKRNPTWGFGTGIGTRIAFENEAGNGLGWFAPEGNRIEQFFGFDTGGGVAPFYSPDNRRLLFEVNGQCLHRGVLAGSDPLIVAENCTDPVWGSEPIPLPGLVASPSPLVFETEAGVTDVQTVTVTNQTAFARRLNDVALFSPVAFGTPVFQLLAPGTTCLDHGFVGLVLGPHASCTIRILFNAPLQSGSFPGQLRMAGPLTVDLDATIPTVQPQVPGDGGSDQGGGSGKTKLKLNKDDLWFGKVKKGKSAELKLELKNKGSSSVKVESIDVSGKYFWKRKDDCPDKLKPGKKCVIKIKFKPGAKGKFEGEVRVGGLRAGLHGTGT